MPYHTRVQDTRLIPGTRTMLITLRTPHPTVLTEVTLAILPTWLRLRLPRPSREPTLPVDRRRLRTRNTLPRRLLARLRPTDLRRRDTRLSRTGATLQAATVVLVTPILATLARATPATAARLPTPMTLDGRKAVTPATLATLAWTLAPILATPVLSIPERTHAPLILELIPAPLIPAPTLVQTPARWTLALTRVLSTLGTRELLILVTPVQSTLAIPALSTPVTLVPSTPAILVLLTRVTRERTLALSTPGTPGLTPEWILVMSAWTPATCASTLAIPAQLILATCVRWTPATRVLTPGILVQTLASTPGWIPAICVERTLGMSELLLSVLATRVTFASCRGTPETWARANSITARTTCAILAIFLPTLLAPTLGKLTRGRWIPEWRTPGRSTRATCVILAMFATHETCATQGTCATRGTFVTLAWTRATWTRTLARRRRPTTHRRAAALDPLCPLVRRRTTFADAQSLDHPRRATITTAPASRATCVFSR